MKTMILILLGLLLAALVIGLVARQLDHRADRAEIRRLLATQPRDPARFDPAMVADLPEPARRYFTYAILPGTPLRTVVRLEMTGQFALGDKDDPRYVPMRASQVLAAPHGFVWKASMSANGLPMSGSDAGEWTRFWVAGTVPVARGGGSEDHRRSAFGRFVSEAVFWTPAALLPGPGVEWAAIDADRARVTLRHDGLAQSVEITVDDSGQMTQVVFPRWSNANPARVYRQQPFGGTLSDYAEVSGFRLPMRVEAGNFFGTDAYFPFFIAEITQATFPPAP